MDTTPTRPNPLRPETEAQATASRSETPPRPSTAQTKAQGTPIVSPATPAGNGGSLLGSDGRAIEIVEEGAGRALHQGKQLARKAGESLTDFSEPLVRFAERNPTRAALATLGVGLVAGALIGAWLKRD